MGFKRFHVVIYFGVCGCSKLKGKKLKPDVVCPVCGSDMPRRVPLGSIDFCKDVGDPNYRKVFACDSIGVMGLPCSLMPVVLEMGSGSSVPICPFDGLLCDGKRVLDSPC
jgi:hypothetical protein